MKKGNIRISADLSDEVDNMIEELEDSVDDAVSSAWQKTAKLGIDEAKQHIRTKDRVWNKDVLNNWIPIREKTPYGTHVTGYQNYSVHASVVDEGATYNEEKPNWDNLREYVVSEFGLTDKNRIDWATTQLQQHIYDNGLQGIYYTNEADQVMEERGPLILSQELQKRL